MKTKKKNGAAGKTAAEVCIDSTDTATLSRCANPACDKTFPYRSNKDCCGVTCRSVVKRARDANSLYAAQKFAVNELIDSRRKDRNNPHFIKLQNAYTYALTNGKINTYEVGFTHIPITQNVAKDSLGFPVQEFDYNGGKRLSKNVRLQNLRRGEMITPPHGAVRHYTYSMTPPSVFDIYKSVFAADVVEELRESAGDNFAVAEEILADCLRSENKKFDGRTEAQQKTFDKSPSMRNHKYNFDNSGGGHTDGGSEVHIPTTVNGVGILAVGGVKLSDLRVGTATVPLGEVCGTCVEAEKFVADGKKRPPSKFKRDRKK